MAKMIDFGDQPINVMYFDKMLRVLPTAYRRDRRNLVLAVTADVFDDYIMTIATRQGNMADQFLAGAAFNPTFGGIPLRVAHGLPEGIDAALVGTRQPLLTRGAPAVIDIPTPIGTTATEEVYGSVEDFVRAFEDQEGVVLAKGIARRPVEGEPIVIDVIIPELVEPDPTMDDIQENYEVD